ncbi:hypothetical protein ACLBVR_19490, partial [Pseudomonas aeruginosa]|uniref:hypothetical protein n=1 Tax=Pseudomonas aeruginosa TaxID=287 RepID=UPI00396956C2
MYDWWVLQLAKLSVSRKLMVGFGVLLALLLLVVISSNRTLTHQTALSEQLAEVAWSPGTLSGVANYSYR